MGVFYKGNCKKFIRNELRNILVSKQVENVNIRDTNHTVYAVL